MTTLIALVNHSTLVKNSDVDIIAHAIQKQLDLHVLPAWNLKSFTVRFYPDPKSVPNYAWTVNMLDNSTQAGALGYHSEDNDKIDAFIFAEPVLSNGGVVLFDPHNTQNFSVASVVSHEICEMVGDRYANFWVDGPPVKAQDGQTYSEYALELADPVEGDSYEIDVQIGTTTSKVSVSNFILPAWFNPQAKAPDNLPFDYLKKLHAPFSMTPGGYLIVRQDGNEQQIFGEKMPDWKQEMKKNDFYRR